MSEYYRCRVLDFADYIRIFEVNSNVEVLWAMRVVVEGWD